MNPIINNGFRWQRNEDYIINNYGMNSTKKKMRTIERLNHIYIYIEGLHQKGQALY